MRRFLAASLSAGLLFALGAGVATGQPALASSHQRPRTCPRTFTVAMAKRAARAVYGGTHRVTHKQRLMLGRIVGCQRNPAAKPFVRGFYARQRAAWLTRVYNKNHPWSYALASWFTDAGATACGFHVTYGVANKSLPCGTQVEFSYHGRVVTATVEDRGPYVGAREWDLNQNLAAALGFSGVDTVGYRVR